MRFTVINGNELVEYSSMQIKTKYLESCSHVFYRMAVLNISENSQVSTCGRVLFRNVAVLHSEFY